MTHKPLFSSAAILFRLDLLSQMTFFLIRKCGNFIYERLKIPERKESRSILKLYLEQVGTGFYASKNLSK